jgi:hypothetical protein
LDFVREQAPDRAGRLQGVLLVFHQAFDALGDQFQSSKNFQPRFVFRKGVVCDLFSVLYRHGCHQVSDGTVIFHVVSPGSIFRVVAHGSDACTIMPHQQPKWNRLAESASLGKKCEKMSAGARG